MSAATVTPIRGRRGVATRIVLDMNTALAATLEGQALCAEVAAHAERIRNAAMAGSRNAVWNEAVRLTDRATLYRDEFARLAECIEADGDAA